LCIQNAQMARKKYSALEVAKMMGLKKRAVQARAARYGVKKENGAFVFTAHFLKTKWGVNAPSDAHKKSTAVHNAHKRAHQENLVDGNEVGLHTLPNGNKVQVFTESEYKSFELALIERKQLLQQVKQLQDWKDSFIRYTQERNALEAKDKGLIKEIDDVEDAQVMDSDTDLQQHLSTKREEVIQNKTEHHKGDFQDMEYKSDYYSWLENLKNG